MAVTFSLIQGLQKEKTDLENKMLNLFFNMLKLELKKKPNEPTLYLKMV